MSSPSEYILKRHTALWEAQNKSVKRAMLTGVLFGAFVLFNVLQPYVARVTDLNRELDQFIAERERAVEIQEHLDHIISRLAVVHERIEQQPWMAEKDTLIKRFQQMNSSGQPINRSQYQAEADETVRAIAAQVRQDVLQPLEMFYNPPDSLLTQTMPRFVGALTALPQTLDAWVAENIGRHWYMTLGSKEREVEALSSGLQEQLHKVRQIGEEELPKLRSIKFSLVSKILEMNKKREQIEQDVRKKLDEEISRIVPAWINGVISISQIFYGYPLVIVGTIVYVFWLAYTLTQHFFGMAQAEGLSRVDQTDPTLSSVWTLSYRGRMGSVVTLGLYLAFVVTMIWFFEEGITILAYWISHEKLASSGWFHVMAWGGRLGYVAVAAGYVRCLHRAYSALAA